ncbi:hypothetical protein FRC14_006187 [Serendipita sp. 396]|nr:hypothetical protein FRC14_006187 [Serendipita sp. 396]
MWPHLSSSFDLTSGGQFGPRTWLRNSQQTRQSSAVLAIFRALQGVVVRYSGDERLKEAESRVREVIKSLPTQMLNKDLDQMFQKWNTSRTGSFQFKPRSLTPVGISYRLSDAFVVSARHEVRNCS